MTIRGFLRSLLCSFEGKRCLFCDEEVCAYHPEGNPFIGIKYREAMKQVELKKKEREG